MKNFIIGATAAIALVLSVVGLVGGNQSAPLGGKTNYDEITLQDVSGTTTLAVLSPSTAFGGCAEFHATSSATKVNLKFAATATSTTVGSVAGFVVWGYGACE